MTWYQWMALASLLYCFAILLWHFLRLLRKGGVHDYSVPAGKVRDGVIYSYTAGMSPKKKESAYLHLPTYTAGLLYHTGTFLCLLLFVLFIAGVALPLPVRYFSAVILAASGVSGAAILIKRGVSKKLRALSNPDDYLSNLLVTLFHLMTLTTLLLPHTIPFYFVSATLLFLYIPVGKLRHLLYFFAARYHLGFFFGRRGSWPSKTS